MKTHNTSLLAVAICATILIGCNLDDAKVKMVREGHLQMCPDQTVDHMASSFLKDPSWESGKSNDGIEFVNLNGKFTFSDKVVNGSIQFEVNSKNESFQLRALEINELPQINFVSMALLSKMCDAARTAK